MAKQKIEASNNKKIKFNDGWVFALVNGRLVEIFFNKKFGIYGYCRVKREEYKTKREQKMIDEDIKQYRFSYRKGIYRDLIKGYKITEKRGSGTLFRK